MVPTGRVERMEDGLLLVNGVRVIEHGGEMPVHVLGHDLGDPTSGVAEAAGLLLSLRTIDADATLLVHVRGRRLLIYVDNVSVSFCVLAELGPSL